MLSKHADSINLSCACSPSSSSSSIGEAGGCFKAHCVASAGASSTESPIVGVVRNRSGITHATCTTTQGLVSRMKTITTCRDRCNITYYYLCSTSIVTWRYTVAGMDFILDAPGWVGCAYQELVLMHRAVTLPGGCTYMLTASEHTLQHHNVYYNLPVTR